MLGPKLVFLFKLGFKLLLVELLELEPDVAFYVCNRLKKLKNKQLKTVWS